MMESSFRAALATLGHDLPPCARSVGAYVGHKVVNGQFWCVQGPLQGDDLAWQGRVGDDFTLEDAQACARQVALNIIAQLDQACGGDMDRVAEVVRLGGYVNAVAGFCDHSKVMNGASELFIALLGDRGAHTRFATGCSSMPYNLAVEIEAVIQLRP
jgi:enamine deaminase RidA (YjgF/YER057c/UK114 family)